MLPAIRSRALGCWKQHSVVRRFRDPSAALRLLQDNNEKETNGRELYSRLDARTLRYFLMPPWERRRGAKLLVEVLHNTMEFFLRSFRSRQYLNAKSGAPCPMLPRLDPSHMCARGGVHLVAEHQQSQFQGSRVGASLLRGARAFHLVHPQ